VGTANSTNIIDLHMLGIPVLVSGQGARDIGIGDDPAMKVLVQVTTSFAGAGASLTVNFQGAPDNGAGAPGTFSTYVSSPSYAVGTLIAGARLLDIDVPRPPAGVPFPRFLRLTYTTAGATTTAGAIAADLVLDRVDQPLQANAVLGGYPPGIAIAN
jgi:hypothetical protein